MSTEVHQALEGLFREHFYPRNVDCPEEVSIPSLPANVLESILTDAWLASRSPRERIHLLTTVPLVSRVFLHIWLYVTARDIFIPSHSYEKHLLEYCNGRSPLTLLLPAVAELPGLLCKRLTFCYEGDETVYEDRPSAVYNMHSSIAVLRSRSLRYGPPPDWLPEHEKSAWKTQIHDAREYIKATTPDIFQTKSSYGKLRNFNSQTIPLCFGVVIASKEARALTRQYEEMIVPCMCFSDLYNQLFQKRRAAYRFEKPSVDAPIQQWTWAAFPMMAFEGASSATKGILGVVDRAIVGVRESVVPYLPQRDTPTPRLPPELLDEVIKLAWLAPQTIDERVALMTTYTGVNRAWLASYVRASSRDIIVPTPRYLQHLINFYDGVTPISYMFPELSRYPALLCRSIRICKLNCPRDDPSKRVYFRLQDPSISHLRLFNTLVRPVPEWVPVWERRRWQQQETARVNYQLMRFWAYGENSPKVHSEEFQRHIVQDRAFVDIFKWAQDERNAITKAYGRVPSRAQRRGKIWVPKPHELEWPL